jgi:hypothetical protein
MRLEDPEDVEIHFALPSVGMTVWVLDVAVKVNR